MTDSPRYSVSVAAAVVRDDGKFLAIKRADNGHWEPPGGVLESGEPIHAGLVREVQEETGLTVEPERLSGIYQNMGQDILALVFRCRVARGNQSLSDESSDVAWLSRAEVADRMDEAYAVRLIDALGDDSTTCVRTHDGVRVLDG